MTARTEQILQVEDLTTVFDTSDGQVHAVNGVSFSLNNGELLGVVGESGSGKSVTMMSLLQLVPSPPSRLVRGHAMFQGKDLLRMSQPEIQRVRGQDIGFVFQDPMTSLNPVFTIGYQLMEPLRKHMGMNKAQAKLRAAELLTLVGIPSAEDRLRDYPHQFSGGMRQRVMIAIGLACDPKLLIADEPTTALDVTIQAQILELVRELRQKLGMGIIWITHDLGVVAGIADRVMVMYGGQIVELAPVEELFANPQHPYTQALLRTLPSTEDEEGSALYSIEGQPPSLDQPPSACPFVDRCEHALSRCSQELPPTHELSNGHRVVCWLHADTEQKGAA